MQRGRAARFLGCTAGESVARCLLAAAIVTVLVQASGCALAYRRKGLSHYVSREVGRDAADCGTFPATNMREHDFTQEELAALRSCINAAYRSGRPFRFLVERPSIDSYVAWGLIATRSGAVQHFWYDSAPCGGPHCKERVIMTPCIIPPGEAIDPRMRCK